MPNHPLNHSKILAARDNFGSVFRCPAGCIHIAISHVGVRFTEKEFWSFMEMLSEAAQRVARKHPKRWPGPTIGNRGCSH